MRATLLSVRAHTCVIAQCHGSDLVSRYRCAERTYGRQAKAAGGGTSVGGGADWSCRAWFRGRRFRSGHQCHLRAERLVQRGGVTFALEWPHNPCAAAAAAAQHGGAEETRSVRTEKQTNNAAGWKPKDDSQLHADYDDYLEDRITKFRTLWNLKFSWNLSKRRKAESSLEQDESVFCKESRAVRLR